jgi:hypothetical protein
MAAIGDAGTKAADTGRMRSLMLGSAAALASIPNEPNRKSRRAEAALMRKASKTRVRPREASSSER